MELVKEAVNTGARKDKVCRILGLSARTIERWENNPEMGDRRRGPESVPGNKLTPKERQAVIKISTSDEFKDLPPSQIVPRLADKGVYIASEATFYRILKEEKMLAHRSDSKPHTRHKPDEYIATAPNQVWSWDVSVPQQAVWKMEVGPPQPVYRNWLQTTVSSYG